MTPAKQLFTEVDARPVGDCWRTCIAMLLDLPPADVPHWVDQYLNHDDVEVTDWPGFEGAVITTPRWAVECQDWLRARGLQLQNYDGPPSAWTGFAIATGASPRGDFSHAVVVYTIAMERQDTRGDGVLRWIPSEWRYAADPHPSNDYLAGDPTEFAIIQPAEIWVESGGPS